MITVMVITGTIEQRRIVQFFHIFSREKMPLLWQLRIKQVKGSGRQEERRSTGG